MTLDDNTFKYLRSKKARSLHKRYSDEFVEKENLQVFTYNDATILPLKRFKGDKLLFGRGGVVDDKQNYIESSSINLRVQFGYEYSEQIKEDKKVVYCGYLVHHWGHFLIEAVARLWYFLEYDNETIDKYIFFTDYNKEISLTGNYKEFLELLGIYDKIEIINKPTTYRCVIIPELSYKRREYYSKYYKSIFDNISSNVKPAGDWKPFDKIYFTRSALKNISQKEYGLDMLDDYFNKNGYLIVSPEKITLSYLIYLIRNSKICASLSGSLPHNMLFAEDGQKLIIIERNILNNEIQIDVNLIKSLSVLYIDANIGIYPIDLGYGPFIMTYFGRLELFSKDYHYTAPDKKYLTKKYLNKCFKKYMKEYQRVYANQWIMKEWECKYTDYIKEAYDESLQYFGEYIYGLKPYQFSQFWDWHNIVRFSKQFVHRTVSFLSKS